MCDLRHAALLLLSALSLTVMAETPQPVQSGDRSPVYRWVTGPTRTMNEALAAGATAIITLQPVQPKTVPASNYPMGTAIMNQTIYLGSVPSRVWLEAQITNWAPDILRVFQVRIDATDQDGDGGGYYGDLADCGGSPPIGAGDLSPAIVPCSGTCQGNAISCFSNSQCGANGPCLNLHAACRAALSGRTSNCAYGEPSSCSGGVCHHAFLDGCDPESALAELGAFPAVDDATLNVRFGWALNEDEGVSARDFGPSYTGTLVLDVPADAKGRYLIDVGENECFMWNANPAPNNNIPIAMINRAVIAVDTCFSHMDCDDGTVCTVDSCQGGCCEHTTIAGWDPATECCNPTSGAQSPIPQSTSCRTGGCSLGGNSGVSTFTNLPDGTACESDDPCYAGGQCSAGQCVGDQYAGSDCPKSRFISFDVSSGPVRAYRVRLVSLHHPDPPYARGEAADFSAYEGEVRWAGPPASYVESSADATAVYASFVQCQPHYGNWNAPSLLHLTGAEIVPSSVYEVQSIAQGLDINVESNYSAPMTIATGRWADVSMPYSPPNATAQPNASDHAALVSKFRSALGAMSKPRALLSGAGTSGIPDLGLDVGFGEIAAAVDAFRGSPYPYAGPQSCP
jgi:hypothetical protein